MKRARAAWWLTSVVAGFVPALHAQTPPAASNAPVEQGWTALNAEDYATARRVWEPACAAGAMGACSGLGVLYVLGQGVTADPTRGVRMLADACTRGVGSSCGDLALWYGNGGLLGADPARALEFAALACVGDFVEGCALALSYSRAAQTLPLDGVRAALEALERSCARTGASTSPMACASALELLRSGPSGVREQARARLLATQQCDRANASVCTLLGAMFAAGEGGAADLPRAVDAYARACAGADAEGCRSLGLARLRGTGTARDVPHALEALRRACSLDASLCGVLREAEPAAEAIARPRAAAPRWSQELTIETIDGTRYGRVRSTCDEPRMSSALRTAAAPPRRCQGGAVGLALTAGRVTRAQSLSGDTAGLCLVDALRGVRFEAMSCALELTVTR